MSSTLTETAGLPCRQKQMTCDVAVIGGGMAGICAAVAAARTGAQTILIQDRPVLGGNGSSEIRVCVNGAQGMTGKHWAERETGIIEEILLENRAVNPQESYSMWDHVLYDFVTREPNLDLMLNTQAVAAVMDGQKIAAAVCRQLTTEMEITVVAAQFIDCSGDGLLASSAGALYRTGREAASEFNESCAPEEADGWQMGASILMMSRDMGEPMPYEPPSFMIPYDAQKYVGRNIKSLYEGYWWVELGSEFDIIAEQEVNRHKLMGYLHGVWNYIKNSGEFPESENLALDWIGVLPGRRESRRFIGDHILSQNEIVNAQPFDDAVAFGGWGIDEHCPGGIESPQLPPTKFHFHFEKIYPIPFRSLYSKNISNLLFAGRNISQTHIALSSTRIQCTCAVEGQAVGTAAALCVKENFSPRELAEQHISKLQEQLLRDDAFIPGRPADDLNDIAKQAVITASSTLSGAPSLLTDGVSRDEDDVIHHWQSEGLPAEIQLEWVQPIHLSTVEIKCDTNLYRPVMMHRNPKIVAMQVPGLPPEMVKQLEVSAWVKDRWERLAVIDENRRRLIRFQFDSVETSRIRIALNETYGAINVRLFEIRCYA